MSDEESSVLELSDEEVMNMAEPPEGEESAINEVDSGSPDQDMADSSSDDDNQQDDDKDADDDADGAKAAPAADAEVDADKNEANPDTSLMDAFQDAAGGEKQNKSPDKEAKGGKVDDSKEEDGDKAPIKIDYEAAYNELIAPFKANGKEMNVNSVGDARTLMQMGANYNKKMAGLKPNLKLMKMLGNNDLLDEEKLTYLIDLQKKDPAAIAKLMKDADIDPLDIEADAGKEYEPGTYTVKDEDVELDSVLEDIQDTPAFDETIDIIGNKWDDSSKKVVLADPSIIRLINDHVGNGIYGQISDIIDSERVLGRLTELSDLDAYKHVGQILQDQGAFNQPANNASGNEDTDNSAIKPTKASKKVDPKLNSKRRAAGSPGGGSKVNKAPAFDPLSMSDEDFEKAAAQLGL